VSSSCARCDVCGYIIPAVSSQFKILTEERWRSSSCARSHPAQIPCAQMQGSHNGSQHNEHSSLVGAPRRCCALNNTAVKTPPWFCVPKIATCAATHCVSCLHLAMQVVASSSIDSSAHGAWINLAQRSTGLRGLVNQSPSPVK
jgi:hypothetical protein